MKELGIGMAMSPGNMHQAVLMDFPVSMGGYEYTKTPDGPGDSTRIGRQPFGRISIANSDSAPGADAKTAMMMAHRAVNELA